MSEPGLDDQDAVVVPSRSAAGKRKVQRPRWMDDHESNPHLGCALMDEIDQERQDGDAELDDEPTVLVEAVEVTDDDDDMDAIPVYATFGGD